ncbi:tRNA preQ1(34) S-adenosylmethionine ribosyltransferase-isomerase QueA [Candidatus Omnitrophota bacterium]
MRTDEFDYFLPEELIAQFPCEERRQSRLLCVNKNEKTIDHKRFFEIENYFTSGDVLVLNNTKVIPARLFARKKETGANIEVLLLEELFSCPFSEYHDKYGKCDFEGLRPLYVSRWKVLLNPSRRVKRGDTLVFITDGKTEVSFYAIVPDDDSQEKGMERILDIFSMRPVRENIIRYGKIPLPPYIKRTSDNNDATTYQTVYAEKEGAIAAPTAGLHFDEALFETLKAKGVQICCITLHVSYGTFKPIKTKYVKDHEMHTERIEISEETSKIINDAKDEGRRVIACGTTTVRALESAVEVGGYVTSGNRRTSIFIYPSFEFKVIDALVTNFHLPRSSLLMLVSAWGGIDLIKQAYAQAVQEKYRFYSYGDAMFIH